MKLRPFLAIDDFAFRKGLSYGTIVCDLRTNRPIALLNGRDAETVEEWLQKQPKLYVVARDGSVTYKAAITAASSFAVQISDRFHLVQNLSKKLKDAFTRLLPREVSLSEEIATLVPSIQPHTDFTKATTEKWALAQKVKTAFQGGANKTEIARAFHIHRHTVRSYLDMEAPRKKEGIFKISPFIRPYYELIKDRTDEQVTVKAIFEEVKDLGYKGSYSSVCQAVKQFKPLRTLPKLPVSKKTSRQKIISCFWKFQEKASETEYQIIRDTCRLYPEVASIYGFIQAFRAAYQTWNLEKFQKALIDFKSVKVRELKSYLNAIKKDLEAIQEAFLYPFNTSIVEGQINRLKMIKRMMYGRASITLLEKRVRYHS